MKHLCLSRLNSLSVHALALGLLGAAWAAEPLQPLPAGKELPGSLRFHGHYEHRSRGNAFAQPSELWVSQTRDGANLVLAQLPFMGTTELVVGSKENRVVQFRVRKASTGEKPGYGMDIDFTDGKVRLTRRGVREDCDSKELAAPAGASFDPNSRPDSYCAANILLRQFGPQTTGEAREFRVFDWDNSGEGLADYSIQVEFKGKEQVQVPAGTFAARHFVLTQKTSANTWFKKRAGHITDFWVLEDGTIVRILRQREPYELVLLDYDVPGKLPGQQ